ncbi:unnamed protein product [Ilex paraguariensis]|uniref:Uncharacterized protein n=1 Tax=Ilex paraguariensis TaxID=185542 RepID=A0ABC8QSP7_9AQUA
MKRDGMAWNGIDVSFAMLLGMQNAKNTSINFDNINNQVQGQSWPVSESEIWGHAHCRGGELLFKQ